MIVEWDSEKAAANEKKHGVSFSEVVLALEDPLSVTFRDPDHSVDELRFLTFGHDASGRILASIPMMAGVLTIAATTLLHAQHATPLVVKWY